MEFIDVEMNKHPHDKTKPVINRIGCYGIIFNEKNEILIIETNKKAGWEFPGGGCEFDESFENCTLREVKEETGLDVSLFQNQPDFILQTYAFSRKKQEQWRKIDFIFFCNLISANKSELNLDEGEEIIHSKWISINDFLKYKYIWFVEEQKEDLFEKINNFVVN